MGLLTRAEPTHQHPRQKTKNIVKQRSSAGEDEGNHHQRASRVVETRENGDVVGMHQLFPTDLPPPRRDDQEHHHQQPTPTGRPGGFVGLRGRGVLALLQAADYRRTLETDFTAASLPAGDSDDTGDDEHERRGHQCDLGTDPWERKDVRFHAPTPDSVNSNNEGEICLKWGTYCNTVASISWVISKPKRTAALYCSARPKDFWE